MLVSQHANVVARESVGAPLSNGVKTGVQWPEFLDGWGRRDPGKAFHQLRREKQRFQQERFTDTFVTMDIPEFPNDSYVEGLLLLCSCRQVAS